MQTNQIERSERDSVVNEERNRRVGLIDRNFRASASQSIGVKARFDDCGIVFLAEQKRNDLAKNGRAERESRIDLQIGSTFPSCTHSYFNARV